ncbi:hypothetical protein DOY81_003605 [Sarcophaga bullata]|nr:hypothetical protein DOY81_003605 [Sarcophaga bullata]
MTLMLAKRKRMAFLDVLLQATIDGKPLSHNDIREEVDTLCLRVTIPPPVAFHFAFIYWLAMLKCSKGLSMKS